MLKNVFAAVSREQQIVMFLDDEEMRGSDGLKVVIMIHVHVCLRLSFVK